MSKLDKALEALKAVVNGMPEETIDTHVRNLLDRCERVIKEIDMDKPFKETVEERAKRDPEFEKQVTHREACEKIADMQVDSMTTEELKQYVYEDLVELMFNCSDTFEWHAEKWEWTNE